MAGGEVPPYCHRDDYLHDTGHCQMDLESRPVALAPVFLTDSQGLDALSIFAFHANNDEICLIGKIMLCQSVK